MKRIYISDLTTNQECKISGIVENIRDKRTMMFLVIKDISGKIQVTIDKVKNPEIADELTKLTLDSFLTVEGICVENKYVKLNGREILPNKVQIESIASPLPIQREENSGERSSIDQRIDYRWIDLRTDKNQLIFKIQTYMTNTMRQFLLDRNFLEIHTPKLIATASESGSDVFEVKYFNKNAYLAQSPQFYKQMAMASGFEKVFEIGPVFRAEKSFTNKHTTEFTGFDLEFSYINSYHDIMALEEELLTYTLGKIKDVYDKQLKELFGIELVIPTLPFPVIKLSELYEELEKRYGYTVSNIEKGDLTTEAEKLCKTFSMERYGHEFLFITDFSANNRAFYHMRKDGIPQGFDLIWNGVEITTGAQREHRYEILVNQAKENNLEEDVKFYLEFFKYGCPPHGGFGLGIDRLTMLLFGLPIKECMFLFRGPNRLHP
ncbi:MAG: aspartate--tRNA(Asn) ligase [Clostridiales bacterium]|nr:aspartate--tRNA(Asn) ligase [Clostridiales bacterium]